MTQLATQPPASGATRDPKQFTIRERLESPEFAKAIATVMPRHLTPDRFVRIAILAITRTPKLADCDKASFFNALMTLSQYGIEPDGRRAHLIPFWNSKRQVTECQLIIDYKGLAELAQRSGLVSNIHADVVCENDIFEFDRGEIKKHVIHFQKPRGKVYAAYAIARFKDGSEKCDVMALEDINAIRKRSKAGNNGPWVTDFNEMAKKTVFRRLSKWLVLSPEFRDAVEKDDDVVDGEIVNASEEARAMLPSASLASLVGIEDDAADEGDPRTSPAEEAPATAEPVAHADGGAGGETAPTYTADHPAAASWSDTETEAMTLLTKVQDVPEDVAHAALAKSKLAITGIIDGRRAGKETRAALLSAIVAGQYDVSEGKILV